MKRILAFLLLLIYSVSVSGAGFHLHYCGSYLESVSFIDNEHHGCCCEKAGIEMRRSENCCKDVTVVIKACNEHQLTAFAAPARLFSSGTLLLTPTALFLCNTLNRIHSQVSFPPDIRRTEPDQLFLLHCIFRI